jgi:hypothetical protein
MERILEIIKKAERDRTYLESIRDEVASWEETDRYAFYFADESLLELETCLRKVLVGLPTRCEISN